MIAAGAGPVEALKRATGFEAQGSPVGNVTLGRGRAGPQAVAVAFVENRLASGSLGKAEVNAMVPVLEDCARSRTPLVLYLDSAGARVSEGLVALGAYRRLFAAAVSLAASGAPIAAVLGRNCYGGASMLALLAGMRLFSANTQLAMSGPAILASAAGVSALDETFRAMAEATLGTASRVKAAPANTPWIPETDLEAWLAQALAPIAKPWTSLHQRHVALKARLGAAETRAPEAVRRKDLDRLYPKGYEVADAGGLFTGRAVRDEGESPVLGLVGRAPVGADRAWRFAEAAWQMARTPPARLDVLLDCESHAARLDDERIVLSEYVVDMGFALSALAARGTRVELTVLGRAGGGVYVALAAPAARIRTVHGATDIQVLPGSAVASILGESDEAKADIEEYRRSGVADEELKLGLVP